MSNTSGETLTSSGNGGNLDMFLTSRGSSVNPH